MALQESGPISILDIANEFGGTAPHSLSEYYGVSGGIPTSGEISISDFYGASAGIQFLGQVSDSDNGGDFRANLSSLNLMEDDFLLVSYGFSYPSNQNLTFLSGYTEIADLYASDTRSTQAGIYYKIMGSTPDTLIDFSFTPPAGDDTAYNLTVTGWRNVDTSTPLDVSIVTATGTNSNYANPPTITPITTGAYIVTISHMVSEPVDPETFDNFPIFTIPAGLISGGGISSAFINGTSIPHISRHDYYDSWTSGAYNPSNYVVTPTSTSDSWVSATVALRPKS